MNIVLPEVQIAQVRGTKTNCTHCHKSVVWMTKRANFFPPQMGKRAIHWGPGVTDGTVTKNGCNC